MTFCLKIYFGTVFAYILIKYNQLKIKNEKERQY